MNRSTKLFLLNQNGIAKDSHQLDIFCHRIKNASIFKFKIVDKDYPGMHSNAYRRFITKDLEFTVFDYGYALKLEGNIGLVIQLLVEIDSVLKKDISLFVSATEHGEILSQNKFPRGGTRKNIAELLDMVFKNRNHTVALRPS